MDVQPKENLVKVIQYLVSYRQGDLNTVGVEKCEILLAGWNKDTLNENLLKALKRRNVLHARKY